jgi:glycosyltransferase involved in cell wall biosynthesis
MGGFEEVICVDRSIYEYVRDNFGIKPHFIPNAIDTSLFQFHPLTSEFNPLRLIYVGRPDILRGFDLVSQLARNLPDGVTLELVLASGSECRDGPVIPDNSSNVNVRWDMSPKDVREAMARCHVVLNPLKIPVISRVALEAMSCGRPVLAIDRKDNHPIEDGRTGILFDGSALDLKNKIEDIKMGKYDIVRMGRSARELAVNEFGCDVILPKIRDIYKRVANAGTC